MIEFRPGQRLYIPGVRVVQPLGSSRAWWQGSSSLAQSIVAYWKLDEASGARNDSKSSHHLTDNNTVASATGLLYPRAADFDAASNESLTVASSAALQAGNIDWWCAGWFNPALFTNRGIFTQWSGADRGFLFYLANAKLSFALGNGSSSTVAAPQSADLIANRWYFGVGWFDKTANTVNIQVSGGLVIPATPSAAPGLSIVDFAIGAQAGVTTFNFDGLIGPVFFGKNYVPTSADRLLMFEAGLASMASSQRDVFVIAGQSNASGRGTNNQTYTGSGSVGALNYNNAYHLTNLIDPVDANTGQVDSVSSDTTPVAAGSIWPLLATHHISNTGRTPIFVPCAKGATSITAWLPGADHQDRTTLYGSMVYRALQAANYGTLRAVLWWQGETDAVAAMSQATYNGHLDTIANAVMADLGVPLMPCKFQRCSGITDANEDAINAAIAEAWGDNANVATGPDLTGITTDSGDGLHLNADAKLSSAAALWWTALETEFGW